MAGSEPEGTQFDALQFDQKDWVPLLNLLWSCIAAFILCLLFYSLKRCYEFYFRNNGLDSSLLQSIPVVVFNSKDLKDDIHCVICLSELHDGDKARVLPSCDHWFHALCFDLWLHSHNTCPICRIKVGITRLEILTQYHNTNTSTAWVNNEDRRGSDEAPLRLTETEVVVDIPGETK